MARCRVDSSIERKMVDGFAFPLGAYPVEPMTPRAGYTVTFEPADGDDGDSPDTRGMDSGGDGDDDEDGEGWEEWPDRYVFDIAITTTRLEALFRSLFAMLPGRVYPILDVLGQDAFREVDPYVAYELVGQERFLDAVRRYRGFFFEDGLVGFGAMSDEPFLHVFVDEHKIVTVRAETGLRERVEGVLAAFDLEEVEEIRGADAVTHEHRGVLLAPDERPDLLSAEEIVEDLCDEWDLVLNIDADTNVDDDGNHLGVTGWRCTVRVIDREGKRGRRRYAEVYVTAESLGTAESLALEAVAEMDGEGGGNGASTEDAGDADGPEQVVVATDRMEAERFLEAAAADGQTPTVDVQRVWRAQWLEAAVQGPNT